MGVRATLTEIPSDLFEQVIAGREPTFPDQPSHSIDKAWTDFHAVFKVKGPPLSFAIAGDHLYSLSPHRLDDFCDGNHEYYIGFVSPRLVREVADVLSTLTETDYKRSESELFGNDHGYGETFFPVLKAAYTEAAARKNSLMIVIF